MSKPDCYDKVTNRIIELLEEGVIPWRRTWGQYGLAKNYASNRIYHGINALLLNLSEHAIPYFLTWNQIKERNGRVKAGSKAQQVYYYNRTYRNGSGEKISEEEASRLKAQNQKVTVLSFLRYYNVFNIGDVEGMEFEFPEVTLHDNEKIESCEALMSSMNEPPEFRYIDGNRLFYDPTNDFINLPPLENFESAEAYYNGLFHEVSHWTGHQSRLNRPGIVNRHPFGSPGYAKEELIAEISSAFICGMVGIDRVEVTENTTAYIDGWLKVLREDKTFILKVASEAQKAANFILAGFVNGSGT